MVHRSNGQAFQTASLPLILAKLKVGSFLDQLQGLMDEEGDMQRWDLKLIIHKGFQLQALS